MQTKVDIINTLLPTSKLNSINQALKSVYASKIIATNNTKKVTLHHTTQGGIAGSEYIFYGYKKMPYGSNYRYKKNNIKYTTYCHGHNANANYLNNATSMAFNQKTLINANSNESTKGDE